MSAMDVLERVRRELPTAEPSEQALNRAKARLTEVTAGEAKRRRHRRHWAPALVVGAGATVLVVVGAVTLGEMRSDHQKAEARSVQSASPSPAPDLSVAPPAAPEPEPTALNASSAFLMAANAAGAGSAHTVGPGQYLRIRAENEQFVYWDSENGWGENAANRVNAEAAWLVASMYDSYVPFDSSTEWTFIAGDMEIVGYLGVGAEENARSWLDEIAGGRAPLRSLGGPPPPWAGANGEFTLPAFFASMPRDPAEMIEWIRQNQGDPSGEIDDDLNVGGVLVHLLSTNAGSPEVRAAMYRALALLDGTEIVEGNGSAVTVAFHSSLDESMLLDRTVTIDLETGLVTARTETTGSGSSLVADDTPDMRTTYTFTVVDTLP